MVSQGSPPRRGAEPGEHTGLANRAGRLPRRGRVRGGPAVCRGSRHSSALDSRPAKVSGPSPPPPPPPSAGARRGGDSRGGGVEEEGAQGGQDRMGGA